MASELIDLLARLALAGSGAMLLVLLARHALRRVAGAGSAYLSWLAVPAALLAAALPALVVAPVTVFTLDPSVNASALVASVAPAASGWLDWAARIWACGALATGMLLVLEQRAYVRSLGALTERDGVWYAANASHGPALLGLFKPVIVVPSDFAARYSADEQALIIAHERQHAARCDPAANALLAVLQCTFWFNPIMHFAASRFRFDQELACDADVMARHGAWRQAYAAAMLKTQVAGAPALATCHWQSSHPLKERIMQLQKTSTSTPRRHAGRLIVALLACASVFGTVSARAGGAQAYDIAVKFAEGTGNTSAKMRVNAGEEIMLRMDQPGQSWKGAFTVTPTSAGSVQVTMKVVPENGKPVKAVLLMRLGETRSMRTDGAPGSPSREIGATVTAATGV